MAVATIDWPLTLPQQFLIDGYDEKPPQFKIRTDMDSAIAKQRSRFTTFAHPFTGTMLFTPAQYIIFKDFYTTTLGNGTLEFNMPIIGNSAIMQVVRFTEEEYDPVFLGTRWKVAMKLEKLP